MLQRALDNRYAGTAATHSQSPLLSAGRKGQAGFDVIGAGKPYHGHKYRPDDEHLVARETTNEPTSFFNG